MEPMWCGQARLAAGVSVHACGAAIAWLAGWAVAVWLA